MILLTCQQCNNEFQTYPAWVRKGAGKTCSRKCAGLFKKGKSFYVRTDEHKTKMSLSHKALDQSKNRQRFIEINANKKGKTLEELYGDKATRLRESYRLKIGDKNPNWKGGKHRNKYPWIFFKLRQGIIDRDGNRCMNCDMTEDEHKARYTGRGLTIHHIDYDKENNDSMNLITLCIWCNCKANGKREEWQSHYAALLGR